MDREEILNKIRKVQALAEQGVGGEKESAEKRLAEMMEKYDITWEDLGKEEEIIFWYTAKGKDWKMLINQILGVNEIRHAFVDPHSQTKNSKWLRSCSDRPRGANVVMICSRAKFIEMTTAYEIYQRSFDEHYESFVYAFLGQNKLLGKPSTNNRELTPEEEQTYRRAVLMMSGVDKAQINKQIEAK